MGAPLAEPGRVPDAARAVVRAGAALALKSGWSEWATQKAAYIQHRCGGQKEEGREGGREGGEETTLSFPKE